MATENPGLRLGDLLTNAGLLKPADLREAMLIARQQQLPVGRVLIMSGYLSEGQLQSAVQAQSMVKDGLIDFEGAIQALNYVATDHVPLDEALNRMGWSPNSSQITNKLGEFLVEAGLVSGPDVQYALGQCQEIGLPLGRVLVVTGYLTEEMLTNALNAQVLVRDRKISREQAIQGLRAALERQISLEESLEESGSQSLFQTSVRLGELFLGATLIDEANLMNAVEIGLVNEQLIGQVLRDLGLINADVLTAALELQNMVASGDINAEEAVNALFKCHNDGISSYDALERLRSAQTAQAEPPPVAPVIEHIPLYQFLQLGGLITQSDIEKAVHAGSKNTEIMGKMLALSGVMSDDLVLAAKQALSLIIKSSLNMEQAIVALKNCKSTGNSLARAFQELGWDASSLGLEDVPGAKAPESTHVEPVRAQGSPLLKTLRAARAHSVTQGKAATNESSQSKEPSGPTFSWSRTSVSPESGPAAFGEAAIQAAAQAEALDAEAQARALEEKTNPQPAAEEKPHPTTKSLHDMPSLASGWSMNSDLGPSISSVQSKYTPPKEGRSPVQQSQPAPDPRRQTGAHQSLGEITKTDIAAIVPPTSAHLPIEQAAATDIADQRRQTGAHAPVQPPTASPAQAAPADQRWQTGSQPPLPPPMPGQAPADQRWQTGSQPPLPSSLPSPEPPAPADQRWQTGSQPPLPPSLPSPEPPAPADQRWQTGSQPPLPPSLPSPEPPAPVDQRWQTGSQPPLPPSLPSPEPPAPVDQRWQTGSQPPLPPSPPGAEPPLPVDQRWQTSSQPPLPPSPLSAEPPAPVDQRWQTGSQPRIPQPMPGPEPQPPVDQRWQTGSQPQIPQPMPGSEPQPPVDQRWQTGSQPPLPQPTPGSEPQPPVDQRWQTGSQPPLPQPMPGSEPPPGANERWPSGSHRQTPANAPPGDPSRRWQTGAQQPLESPASEARTGTAGGWPSGPPAAPAASPPAPAMANNDAANQPDQRWTTGSQQPVAQPAPANNQGLPPERWQTQPLPQVAAEDALAPEQGWQGFPQPAAPQPSDQPAFNQSAPPFGSTPWSNTAPPQSQWEQTAAPNRPGPSSDEDVGAQAASPPPGFGLPAPDGMPWQSAPVPSAPAPAPAPAANEPQEESEQENQASRRRKNKLNDLMPKSKSKK